MKKSGNYISFALMGAVAELTFFLLFFYKGLNLMNILSYSAPLTIIAFVLYRFFMDWHYFNNPIQKELKDYMINDSVGHKVFFAVIGGGILAATHFYVGLPLTLLWAIGFISSIVGWFFHDVLREMTLYLHQSPFFQKADVKNIEREVDYHG